jgi:hypothetical protein
VALRSPAAGHTPADPGAPAMTALTGPSAEAPEAPAPRTAVRQQLVYKPATQDGFVLGVSAHTDHNFVLSAEVPYPDPQFGESPDWLADLHFVTCTMRGVMVFVGRSYLRVPEDHPALITRTTFDITNLDPWRRTNGPEHASIDIRVRPLDVVSGVPGALLCEAAMSVNDVPCAVGTTHLVFLSPTAYFGHRDRGRARSLTDDPNGPGPTAEAPRPGHLPAAQSVAARPESVGRYETKDVVIGEPLSIVDGIASVEVVLDPRNAVVFDAGLHHMTGPALIEAGRQASLVAAGELLGFAANRCVVTHWSGDFTGFAECDLALLCHAVPEPPSRDAAGRPVVDVKVTYTQGPRQVGVATVTVLQDC